VWGGLLVWFWFAFPLWPEMVRIFSCLLAIWISSFDKVLFSSVVNFFIGSLILGEFSFWVPCIFCYQSFVWCILANIFSYSVGGLFSLETICFWCRGLNPEPWMYKTHTLTLSYTPAYEIENHIPVSKLMVLSFSEYSILMWLFCFVLSNLNDKVGLNMLASDLILHLSNVAITHIQICNDIGQKYLVLFFWR
jgi:hypothetical protein